MNSDPAKVRERAYIKSPGSKRKKSSKRKSKNRGNKENNRMKLLQQAALIAETRHINAEKDFLNRYAEETKHIPKTPTQNTNAQSELLMMLSKENENRSGSSGNNQF